MITRRTIALLALPITISAFGCVASTGATAQSRLAQASPQPTPEDRGQNGQRHRSPDFAAAAQKLGITEAKLKDALGVPANPQATPGQRPPRPDLKAAAAKLGITEQQLVDALGTPPRRSRPNFAAAAQKLGVSEANLKAALGVPANPSTTPPTPGQRPPKPDFKAAAAKLGVTEQQLVDALGVPSRPPQDGNRPDGSRPPQS